ncbi:sigma 54-interacting transcriptional regulator [Metallumcola ferriviriculae]|uniref:HTH-type transcriptional regulatory protein TyrR n=1 Tax=Metallumcola ferriviriculae TaxID=3039180 RepID=A0AAU0UQW4_9FIRM|nr:sigma 54-interacting transcriptional regulator [Desulfitibacteraceae bacterium MK1]
MLVRQICNKRCVVIEEDAVVASALKKLEAAAIPMAPVLDEQQKIRGVVSLEVLRGAAANRLLANTPVAGVMSEDFLSISDDASLDSLWELPTYYLVVMDSQAMPWSIVTKDQIGGSLFRSIKKRADQLENVLEFAHNGIIGINKEGVVTVYNRAAEEIIWRKKKDALGRHLSQVIIPQGLLDILETGEVQLAHKFTVEYANHIRTYMTHRTPIFANGEIIGAVGVFQDISEIEAISNELNSVKQLNEELRTIIDASYDGILVADAEGVVHRVNGAFERVMGIDAKDILDQPLDKAVDNISTTIVAAVTTSKKRQSTVVERAGSQLLLTGNPVLDKKEELTRVVINVRDLTELNELRSQLEQSEELTRRYHSELNELRNQLMEEKGIVVHSAKMKKVLDLVLRVAQVDSTVLLLGESGVGKEIVAKVIHANSKREQGPFIKVNCGAIPENLLESELFGYEPGAFTGASRDGKLGLFELAHNGTLLLDEIGDLPLSLQVKLLRAIQDREIYRVGGQQPRLINVRIVAATNQNLEEMRQKGEFREDLYFRLNVIPINIPPLRERKEEIVPLVKKFKNHFCEVYGLERQLSPEVTDCFWHYDWPGNIRELENIIERLVVTSRFQTITVEELPEHLQVKGRNGSPGLNLSGIMPLKDAMLELEKQLLSQALKEYGSTYKAAQALGVNQSTIVRKINRIKDEFGIDLNVNS